MPLLIVPSGGHNKERADGIVKTKSASLLALWSLAMSAPLVAQTTPIEPTLPPPTRLLSVCVGDCGGSQTVAINNIITLVNIALGTAQPSACPNGVPSSSEVNVAVIIQAVNNALNGCSAATSTPTPTPQAGAACAGKPDGTTCGAGTDSVHTLVCSGGACGQCTADTSSPRFMDNGDGTITDRLTCLVWEKKDNAGGLHDKDKTFSWCADANRDSVCDSAGDPPDGSAFTVFLAGMNGAGFAGHRDWRLPREDGHNGPGPNELESILTTQGPLCPAVAPCVDAVFTANCGPGKQGCTVDGAGGTQECSCTRPNGYWSATTYPVAPTDAWFVYFVGGGVNSAAKTGLAYVRAVRGGL